MKNNQETIKVNTKINGIKVNYGLIRIPCRTGNKNTVRYNFIGTIGSYEVAVYAILKNVSVLDINAIIDNETKCLDKPEDLNLEIIKKIKHKISMIEVGKVSQ